MVLWILNMGGGAHWPQCILPSPHPNTLDLACTQQRSRSHSLIPDPRQTRAEVLTVSLQHYCDRCVCVRRHTLKSATSPATPPPQAYHGSTLARCPLAKPSVPRQATGEWGCERDSLPPAHLTGRDRWTWPPSCPTSIYFLWERGKSQTPSANSKLTCPT